MSKIKRGKYNHIHKIISLFIVVLIITSVFSITVSANITNEVMDIKNNDLSNSKLNSKMISENTELTVQYTTNEVSNDDITLILYNNGIFTIKNTSDDKYILHPSRTSYISINVDGIVYTQLGLGNDSNGNLDYYISTPLTYIGTNLAYINYTLPENILIVQNFELVGKAVKFTTKAINLDGISHNVSVRYLFDTQLDQNDGSPLYATGIGVKTNETDIINPNFSNWKSYDIYPNPTFESIGSFLTKPDRMVFGYWPNAKRYSWDYTPNPNKKFYTPGYSPRRDSCVLLYWNFGTLSTGEINSATTYYGTGYGTGEPREGGNDSLNDLITKLESFKITTQNLIDQDTYQLTEMHTIYYTTDGNKMGLIEDIFGHYGGIIIDSSPISIFSWCIWESICIWITNIQEEYSKNIYETLQYTYNDLDPSDFENKEDLRNEIERDFTGQNGFEINGVKGAVNVKERQDERYNNLIFYLENQESLPLDFPIDEVLKKIDMVESDLQSSSHAETTVKWINPDQNLINFDRIGSLNIYYSIMKELQLMEDSGEKIRHVGYVAGVGGILAGKVVLLICSAGVITTMEIAFSLTAMTAIIGAAQQGASMVEYELVSTMGIGTISATAYYPDEIAKIDNIFNDTLNYVHDSIQTPPNEEYSCEIVDIEMQDIILDAPNEIGSATGLITISNTGSQDAKIKIFMDIFSNEGVHISIAESEISEIKSGETLPVFLSYSAPDMALLNDATQFTSKIWVAIGTNVIFEQSERTTFCVGTQEACNEVKSQTISTVQSGDIIEGNSQQQSYTTQSNTAITEFDLSYEGSDLDLHIYDSLGNHVGVDYGTGEIENNIANATYSGPNTNPEWVTIINSSNETYITKVVAMQTNGNESYFLNAIETPEFPALLSTSPSNLTLLGASGETVKGTLMLSEYGGFNNLTDINIIASNLSGSLGFVIGSSNLTFDIPSKNISAASSMLVNATITIPNNIPYGTYTGLISINDSNNAMDNSSITLEVSGPDAVIDSSDLSILNNNSMEGDLIKINATIHNFGIVNIENMSIQFLINNEIKANNSISIEPGETNTTQYIWTGIPGLHNITVIVDPLDLIYELNETNNNATMLINVKEKSSGIIDAIATPDVILNDNGRPRIPGTNVTVLNATVLNVGSGVANVTIDLSPIGGSGDQVMERIAGTDVWTVATTATDGINLTHELVVTASDGADNTNTSVIGLTVLLRGDVVRDGDLNSADALYIAKYLVGKEDMFSLLVGDISPAKGDGKITTADALYLAKYLVGKGAAP